MTGERKGGGDMGLIGCERREEEVELESCFVGASAKCCSALRACELRLDDPPRGDLPRTE